MSKFEKISRFKNIDLPMPSRSTEKAAGYDFVVAEDIIIPSLELQYAKLPMFMSDKVFELQELAELTKTHKARPTLVSTGMKCYLEEGEYLELSVRSSTPLKHWLVLANGVGIIDGDYVDNPENEGEIFFQLINLSPYSIALKKGDKIGQGIIKTYHTVEGDAAAGKRSGGFGSTDRKPASRSETHIKIITTLENKPIEDMVKYLTPLGMSIYSPDGKVPKPTSLILDELTKMWKFFSPVEQATLLNFLGSPREATELCAYFNGPFEYAFTIGEE